MIFIPSHLTPEKHGFSFSLYVARKEILQSHIKEKMSLGISLDHMTSELQALLRFSNLFFPKEKLIFHIHLKRLQTLCLLSKEKGILGSSLIPFGWNSFIHQEKDIDKINLDSIFKSKKNQIDEWINQIKKNLLSQESHGLKIPFSILVTGSPIGEGILKKAKIFNEKFLTSPISPKQSSYALSIGIALDALSFDSHQVQFLQREFFPQKSKKRLLMLSGFYGLISMILLISSTIFTSNYWKQKEKILKRQLIESLNKDPNFVLPESSKKSSLLPLLQSTEQKIASDLQTPYPMIFSLPRISEILPWLQSFFDQAKETFRLESLDYEMTQYPTVEKRLPFEAKVKLSFFCKDSLTANQFTAFLTKDTKFILQNKKILWKAKENDFFEAEFFLKYIDPSKTIL